MKAQLNARDLIERDTEPVPCPHCGWIQRQMVANLRKGKYRWISKLAALAILAGGITTSCAIILAQHEQDGFRWTQTMVTGMAALSIGVALLVMRWVLAGQYNPNEAFPRLPKRIPGTPQALLAAGPPDIEGNIPLRPAADHEFVIEAGWIEWRLLIDQFAPVCCRCLGVAEYHFQTPLASGSNLPVPLCSRCGRRIVLKWWICALLSAAAGFGFAYVAASSRFMPGHSDGTGKQIFTVFVGLILAIAAVAVFPPRLVRPYRMKILDRRRHVVRMKFAHSGYTQILADHIRQIADKAS